MSHPGQPRLCVLILQYNSADLTVQLLESIEKHEPDWQQRYDIIVMDNCSVHPKSEEIRQLFPGIQFVQFDKNYGFAVAHNKALQLIDHDWVLLLNNDCILESDAISRVFTQAREHGADFATCDLRNSDGSAQLNFSTTPTPLRNISLQLTGINRLIVTPWRLRRQLCRVGYVNGAFLLLRVATIPPPYLFPDDYFMYGEDLDLMIRMHKHGRKGIRVGGSPVVHLGGASAQRKWGDDQQIEQKRQRQQECLARHFPQWQVNLYVALKSILQPG